MRTRTKVSFVAGKMAIEMVCKTGKSTMTMTESGTFTPTSYQLDAKTVMSGASSMTQVMKISAKRVGDCKKP